MNGRIGRYLDTIRYNALLPQAEQELVQSSLEIFEKEVEKLEHGFIQPESNRGVLPSLGSAPEA